MSLLSESWFKTLARPSAPTGIPVHNRTLDWRPASDRTHEQKWAFRSLLPISVERIMRLPWWHWSHDQGYEGSCVGHGTAMERSISNIRQERLIGLIKPHRYDTIDIWNRAKEIDEWSDTNPGDDNGTSVHAGYDVCLTLGLIRVDKMVLGDDGIPRPVGSRPRSLDEGIQAVRWGTTVDDVRSALYLATPVTIGINWYTNFDRPVKRPGFNYSWVGEGKLGSVRGGHCVTIFGASDAHQAVCIKNSWGADYPLIWMPYTVLERVLAEDGEAAIPTDK